LKRCIASSHRLVRILGPIVFAQTLLATRQSDIRLGRGAGAQLVVTTLSGDVPISAAALAAEQVSRDAEKVSRRSL
jgi:hypothetical protein